ncbi:type VI secretion system Vgr family protein, partial [Pseudomonas mangiferae]
MNRVLNVTTALGPTVLRFAALSGREALSRLFDFMVTLKSEQKDLDPESMLGTPVTVEIELQGGGTRHLNGQCIHFSQVGKQGRYYLYEAQVKPWLWYATRRSDYQIFQNLSVPDMVKKVLGAYPFQTRFMLSRSYRTWEYCVQYRETDANFVMRMLENEGIWFWFEHSAGEHVMVITDDVGLCDPFPGYATVPYYGPDFTYPDKDHLDHWTAGGRVKPGKYMARDYNFKMPRADLTTRHETPGEHAHGSYDIFDYPGGYATLDEGDPYARSRMEELHAAHKRGHAAGRARGMAPGRLFTLENHP